MMKRALVTGITGQDGSYLAELLISKEYEVFGLARAGSSQKNVPRGVTILTGDLGVHDSLRVAVAESKPDEVYNLGGVSDHKTAFAFPEKTLDINYRSVGILLNESLKINKNVRFLQASSSDVFLASLSPLDENSARDWETKNPYAKAKLMADRDFIAGLREKGNAFACSAILFTHESPRRSEKGVGRKIVKTLTKIKLGREKCLQIGNLEMCRDWGFAGDYVSAMWRMLQLDKPEDLVIATGKIHSIKDWINLVAKVFDIKLTWQGEGANAYAVDEVGNKTVEVVPDFYRPTERYFKVGDIRKAEQVIKWRPKVNFEDLVEMMVKSDLADLRRV
ncbi:MAG TPA: GDP-mannose 4,6-dehydratase [Candidatus Paceibacterota bacterium]